MISRRKFLKKSSEACVAIAAASGGLASARSEAVDQSIANKGQRAQQAFEIRCDSARADTLLDDSASNTNGDEERYADRRANFAKTLPHNERGEVDARSYTEFVSILSRGDPDQFEQVPRDPHAAAKLNNPQATYAFDLVGIDSHATHLPPPPTFASRQMAVEMAELYWQRLTADVPFRGYETDPMIAAAVSDLNAFFSGIGFEPGREDPA